VSKSESVLHFHNRVLPNGRDRMFAIALRFPSLCMGVSGHARCILRRIARACMRCSATIDCFDARRVAQSIDGELLQNNVIGLSWSGPHTPSIDSHNISRPAILRSEFETVPIQFCNDLIFAWISSCHCHLNTVGVQADSSPKTPPPPMP
jgi:hypothetical protein